MPTFLISDPNNIKDHDLVDKVSRTVLNMMIASIPGIKEFTTGDLNADPIEFIYDFHNEGDAILFHTECQGSAYKTKRIMNQPRVIEERPRDSFK